LKPDLSPDVSRGIRVLPAVLSLVIAFCGASCASRIVVLPSGDGTDFPDYAPAYARATASCTSVRSLVAILSISGRAFRQRLRAKLDAGFEAPSRVRLELPAPGKPFFTFVADGTSSTLVLARDGRVLRDSPPAETLEALAGVSVGPDDLRTIVAGCGVTMGTVTRARLLSGGWAAIDAERATIWLQQVEGDWRLAAAITNAKGQTGALEVRYGDFAAGHPATIRLRALTDQMVGGQLQAQTDLTIRLSQVEINQPIDPAAFAVDIPADAVPITLDELRRAGPLGR
jgi:hypothetical protein